MDSKQKVGLVIVFVNIFLFLIKGFVWFFTDSIAVQSEAFNSLVDSIYSLIIITGFLLSRRDKTSEYPEGLIRLEPLVSIVVSGVIVITGLGIAYNGIEVFISGSSSTSNSSLAILVLLVSSIFKLALYKYVSKKAKEHNSPSLAATSIDSRNDVLTSVIAVVGVLSFVLGYGWFEGVVGFIIAVYISYSGIKVFEENIEYALGRSVEDDVKQNIINSVLENDDIYGVHDLEVHYTGPIVDVSLHIEVRGNMSIEEGHKLEIEVADSIREACSKEVNEINIHLDPDSLDEWKN